MASIRLKPRIILIEDDPDRITLFRQWVTAPFVLVEATSGGQALGLLKFGAEGIAGICLDHDLNTNPRTLMDNWTSGSDVVTMICGRIPRTVPILVHSMNTTKGHEMTRRLAGAGYSVTRVRFAVLTEERFRRWLDDVRDDLDLED
jgi:CheY-like chemotaxis protein